MERIWDELVTALKLQKATEPEQVVDVKTGEITAPEEDLLGEEEKVGAAAPKPKRDPATLKNTNDLLKACNQDFKMQPKQVYAELNISGPKEIADPAEAYQRIAAVRG
ncbi:unnamed protein product [marine sediment metagenome]|uniref:Uncharacterized protein n=2 Tax=marine sediment metagenome TaxID=412755 RepID=X1Q4G5_9ZZZZ